MMKYIGEVYGYTLSFSWLLDHPVPSLTGVHTHSKVQLTRRRVFSPAPTLMTPKSAQCLVSCQIQAQYWPSNQEAHPLATAGRRQQAFLPLADKLRGRCTYSD